MNSWDVSLYRGAVAASIAVLGSAVALDANSITADTQFIFARGAFTLIGLGLLAMVVAVVILVVAIAPRPQGSPQRRSGVILLFVLDAVMLWFAICWFQRRSHPLVPASDLSIVVSALVIIGAVAAYVWEVRPIPAEPAATERVAASAAPEVDVAADAVV